MEDSKYGTFEQLLDIASPEMRPIAMEVRKLVFDVHADAMEVVRLGDPLIEFKERVEEWLVVLYLT